MPNSLPYKFNYSITVYPRLPFFYKIKNLALLRIGLSKNRRTTIPEAFVDTGSQYCLFYSGYAKYLGIADFKKVERDHIIPIMGIAGKYYVNNAYFHTVDLIFYKSRKPLKIDNAIVMRDIEVGFLEKEFDIGGILGVYGFLDRFIFKTNIKEQHFELQPLFEAVI